MKRPDLDQRLIRYLIFYLEAGEWKTSTWRMTAMYAAVQYANTIWDVVPDSGQVCDEKDMPLIDDTTSTSSFMRKFSR